MSRMARYLYRLAAAGALAGCGCARASNEQGAAPLDNSAEMALGQHVTVIGQVDQVRGDQTFTVKYTDLTSDLPLLVIAKRPTRQVITGNAVVFRGEWVRIHGTVRRLDASEVEQAYGFDLDPDLEVQYADRPVVVTDWIAKP